MNLNTDNYCFTMLSSCCRLLSEDVTSHPSDNSNFFQPLFFALTLLHPNVWLRFEGKSVTGKPSEKLLTLVYLFILSEQLSIDQFMGPTAGMARQISADLFQKSGSILENKNIFDLTPNFLSHFWPANKLP